MSWDKSSMQTRFRNRVKLLETDVNSLRRKAEGNANYTRFHDEQVGALYVNMNLECDQSIMSKETLLVHLRELLIINFDVTAEVFEEKHFKNGITNEINSIISSIECPIESI